MAFRRLLLVVLCPLVAGGCGVPVESPERAPTRVERPAQPRNVSGTSGAQNAFAERVLKASATNGVITDARMRGGNELGVVVGRQVKLKELKPLLVTLLKEMRKQFPDRDLVVRAYAPNNKLMATMKYDDSAPSESNVSYETEF